MVTTGTVVIGGGAVGGAGGTSMVDNNTFTPGGTSITPAGGYVGGRQVASGNAGAFAMSASGILQVHVVAGGAGGGAAELKVVGTTGNYEDVGLPIGGKHQAVPIMFPASLNFVQGTPTMHAIGTVTVNLGNIPTVNLGSGTVNVGNIPGVVGSVRAIGAGGSMGMVGLGGSIGVTPIGDFTVWLANQAGGSGFASVAVYGSPANPVYNVGTTHISNVVNVVGSQFVVGRGGSMGVVAIGDFTVWLANQNAGSGFASVAVYGSPANPVYNIGTVNVSNVVNTVGSQFVIGRGGSMGVVPIGDFTVWLANAAANSGFASVAVYGSPGMPIYNIGTVHVSNFSAGTGFASVAVYGSPAMPVYAVASAHITNGSLPVINMGGSVGVTQIGAPWSVTGSVGVTPLATFTVALDKIPTVNLGLGTVNVGNIVTATLPAVTVVDTRGSLVPTQWPISLGGSGYSAISVASIAGGVRTKLYAIHISTRATVNQAISFQSPSGTFLTGSLPIPPGAGFNVAGAIHSPVMIGGSNATLFIHATGTEHIGGWVNGYIEVG